MVSETLSLQLGGCWWALVGPAVLLEHMQEWAGGFATRQAPAHSRQDNYWLHIEVDDEPCARAERTPYVSTLEPVLDAKSDTFRLYVHWASSEGRLLLRRETLSLAGFAIAPPVASALKTLTSLLYLRRRGALLHAASVLWNGRGYCFLGRSGAGKSTLAEMFPREAVLNDELTGVIPESNQIILESTPFFGTMRNGEKCFRRGVLERACWLEKSQECRLTPLDNAAALRAALRCIVVPSGVEPMVRRGFAVAEDLVENCEWYRLDFRKQQSAILGCLQPKEAS